MDKNNFSEKEAVQLPLWRRMMKLVHVEGIPWPGTIFYNAVSSSGIFQRHYELVATDIAKYCRKGKVLDIGTGPGWLLLKLNKIAPQLQIIGMDISKAMVAKARENIAVAGIPNNISIEQGSADLLPYPDNYFELIVSTGSLHHWKNPVRGINEIYRILIKGGRARIYDIVTDIPADVLRNAAQEFGRLKMLMLWLHAWEEPFYSREATLALAEASLFKAGSLEFIGVLCCLDLQKPL